MPISSSGITPFESWFNLISATNPAVDGSNPSTVVDFDIKIGFFNGATGASGIIAAINPGFPNGIAYAAGTTTAGTSANPVINAGSITKSAISFIYPGVASGTAVKFMWIAVGW